MRLLRTKFSAAMALIALYRRQSRQSLQRA
jgi:hypothetical protein